MNSEVLNRWVDAGKILAEDPSAQIDCPVCQSCKLKVTDVKNEANSMELERHMKCDLCGASNSLRLNISFKRE